jgi:hypothetical protein
VNATTYYGQNALFPCDARQRRAGRPARIPAFVGAIGARAGELAIWTDTTGVVAAPAAG